MLGVKALQFALRAIPRDLRAREMRILAAALSAVGFFTDRVDGAMERQANSLLKADLMLEAADRLPPRGRNGRGIWGSPTAHTVTFRTVVVSGDRTELVSAKAVSPAYPLRGEVRIADRAYGDATADERGLASGEVWLDPRLFGRLACPSVTKCRLDVRTLRSPARWSTTPTEMAAYSISRHASCCRWRTSGRPV